MVIVPAIFQEKYSIMCFLERDNKRLFPMIGMGRKKKKMKERVSGAMVIYRDYIAVLYTKGFLWKRGLCMQKRFLRR